jgi:hypothetical protein
MEGIYDKQKATLEKLASPHNSYLTDGIMYYRVSTVVSLDHQYCMADTSHQVLTYFAVILFYF